MTPDPDGFSLDNILDLKYEDQQFWLQAMQNARIQGLELLQSPLEWMHQLMTDWLHPLSPIIQLVVPIASSPLVNYPLRSISWHDSYKFSTIAKVHHRT